MLATSEILDPHYCAKDPKYISQTETMASGQLARRYPSEPRQREYTTMTRIR